MKYIGENLLKIIHSANLCTRKCYLTRTKLDSTKISLNSCSDQQQNENSIEANHLSILNEKQIQFSDDDENDDNDDDEKGKKQIKDLTEKSFFQSFFFLVFG